MVVTWWTMDCLHSEACLFTVTYVTLLECSGRVTSSYYIDLRAGVQVCDRCSN